MALICTLQQIQQLGVKKVLHIYYATVQSLLSTNYCFEEQQIQSFLLTYMAQKLKKKKKSYKKQHRSYTTRILASHALLSKFSGQLSRMCETLHKYIIIKGQFQTTNRLALSIPLDSKKKKLCRCKAPITRVPESEIETQS